MNAPIARTVCTLAACATFVTPAAAQSLHLRVEGIDPSARLSEALAEDLGRPVTEGEE